MDPNLAAVVIFCVFGCIATVAMCLRISFKGGVGNHSLDVDLKPPESDE